MKNKAIQKTPAEEIIRTTRLRFGYKRSEFPSHWYPLRDMELAGTKDAVVFTFTATGVRCGANGLAFLQYGAISTHNLHFWEISESELYALCTIENKEDFEAALKGAAAIKLATNEPEYN